MTGERATAGLKVRVKPPGERRSMSRSASRALDLLEIFGQVRRPLRAVEIARALDLHPSTANQLLKTLVDSAHLTFDAVTKSYLPSPRFARFGAWMVDSYGAHEDLRDLVQQVQQATGEIVTLTTPNDLFMQVMDSLHEAAIDLHEPATRGLRVSIFGSATGSAYLSTLPAAEVARLADRARLAADVLPALIADLDEVRRTGVADCASGDGMWSLAAPIRESRFPAPLVLGLAGPEDRIRARLPELRLLMRSAATHSGRG